MDKEVSRIVKSFVPAVLLVAVLWIVKMMEWNSGHLLTEFGVFPRHLKGLVGIITSPLVHGDFKHLISNSLPLLVLVPAIFYFYHTRKANRDRHNSKNVAKGFKLYTGTGITWSM